MRRPVRSNPKKQKVSVPTSFPIPILGLNARDDQGDMDPRYALKMLNAFPEADKVSVRRGHTSYSTGMSGTIDTLMAWRGPSSVKLLASSATQTYVASSGTASSSGTAHTGGKWQYANFTTSGGHFIIMVNGTDTPRKYDGTTLATTSVTGTGLTSSNLVNIVSHKSRLWFIEKDTMNAWYLPTLSISGALTKFPVGSVFKDGGSIIAGGTYSEDTGDGIDDYLAFISSTGEVLLYQGTDPSDATKWAIVGRYKTGAPLGRRCTTNLGGDLLFLTEEGVISMKSLMKYDRAQQELASVSNKIDSLIKAAARLYSANHGWQIMVYPKSSWLLVNVPAVEGTRQYQYVMNTITGAWCQFDSLNGNAWETTGTGIFFAGTAKVWQADSGYKDNGGSIVADIKTAYNYFNARGIQKLFGLIRPVLTCTGSPQFTISGNVDFEDKAPSGDLSVASVSESLWDTALWDTGTWAGVTRVIKKWTTLSSLGMCLAVRIKIAINGGACSLNSFDMAGEPGGTL